MTGRSHCYNMQKNRSKRYLAAAEKVDGKRKYPLSEAVKTLKTLPPTKFDQTVTLSFKLGVDPKQSDQMVRGHMPASARQRQDSSRPGFRHGAGGGYS